MLQVRIKKQNSHNFKIMWNVVWCPALSSCARLDPDYLARPSYYLIPFNDPAPASALCECIVMFLILYLVMWILLMIKTRKRDITSIETIIRRLGDHFQRMCWSADNLSHCQHNPHRNGMFCLQQLKWHHE